ncbi:MAG: PLP-dependent aminotransferase family protein [Chloroflexia bacterium]
MTATTSVQDILSEKGKQLSPNPRLQIRREGVISFAAGFPSPDNLPYEAVVAATQRALTSDHGEWPLQYGPAVGYAGLLDLLVEKMNRDQGIACSRENLMLTSGGSQALGLMCDLFIDRGDTILSEAPTWAGAVHSFKNLGANVVSVPVDDEGANADVMEEQLKELRAQGIQPKAFYIIPNFQNPYGSTTTLERRKKIVALAREYNFAIFEDDAYHDLRFSGERLPTLYTLDGGEHTLYFGTFSKILSPGMRLGWIVANPALINRLAVLKIDGSTNPFAAHVAYEFCKDGALEARIQELIANYKHRRDFMIGELNERMPEGVSWAVPDGGFFIWLKLPEGVDSTKVLQRCRERNVEALSGVANFFDGAGTSNIRLAFSYATDEQTARGMQVLAESIQAEMGN